MEIEKFYRVARRDLVYLKFIMEAYEGLSVMSTVENEAAIVRIATFPWFSADVDDIIRGLREEIEIVETSAPCSGGTGGHTDAGKT